MAPALSLSRSIQIPFAGHLTAEAPAYPLSDGRFAVVVRPPLGRVQHDQKARLADIARRYAFDGLVATDETTFEVRGVDAELVPVVVDAVHAAGLPVQGDR